MLEIIHEVNCKILKKMNSKNSLLACPRMVFKNHCSFYSILHAQNMIGNFDLVICTGFQNILFCTEWTRRLLFGHTQPLSPQTLPHPLFGSSTRQQASPEDRDSVLPVMGTYSFSAWNIQKTQLLFNKLNQIAYAKGTSRVWKKKSRRAILFLSRETEM